jgi:hypothetical protein
MLCCFCSGFVALASTVETHASIDSSVLTSCYQNVLRQTESEFYAYNHDSILGMILQEYAVYDIDNNGIAELFVKAGTCEADYMWRLYTVADNIAIQIAEIGGGHSQLYSCSSGGFYHFYGHMGYWEITAYTYANGALAEEHISSGELSEDEEYPDDPGVLLITVPIDDYSLLLNRTDTIVNAGGTELQGNVKVIANAQSIYNDLVDLYGGTAGYVDVINSARQFAWKSVVDKQTLNMAASYIVDYSSAAVNAAVSVLTLSPDKAVKSVGETAFGLVIDDMTSDLMSMSLDDFVYSQARAGNNQVSLTDFMDAGFRIEDNNGIINDMATAVDYIKSYQNIQMGMASLTMGKQYFNAKLNESAWNTLWSITKKSVEIYLSDILASEVGKGLFDKYLVGTAAQIYYHENIVQDYYTSIEQVAERADNEYVTTWKDQVISIMRETELLLGGN